jgi:predicted DNA-binding ribbon-helix-helix protein
MKSAIVKRSVIVAGHKTSVSLEDPFWKSLREIAIVRHSTLSDLVASIDSERRHGNLSSAIRLFVLSHYKVRSNGYHEVGQAPHEIIVSPPPAH